MKLEITSAGQWLSRTEFGHPCSKGNAPGKCEKWHSRCLKPGRSRLHPELGKGIWKTSCDEQVDPFASADTTHCRLWFSERDQDSPLGQYAFAHNWQDLLLYAFSPIPLIHALLDGVQREKHHILLVAPQWPSLAWFPLLLSLHTGDFFKEGPSITNWRAGTTPSAGISTTVVVAIGANSRVSSSTSHQTQFYIKEPFRTGVHPGHQSNPLSRSTESVCKPLQSLFEVGKLASTLKIYVAAIFSQRLH